MVYLIGFGKKLKKELWAGDFQCKNCNRMSNFHLYKLKEYGSVFYIPVISKTAKRLLVCDNCQTYSELSKKQYNDIYISQNNRLKRGDFPNDIIKQDFNPKELKYKGKMLLLILAAMFAFIMIGGAISMGTDISVWDASVPIGIFIMSIIGIIPLVLCIRSSAQASYRKKIYDSISKIE